MTILASTRLPVVVSVALPPTRVYCSLFRTWAASSRPSARPSDSSMARPMTAPMSFIPVAPVSRTALLTIPSSSSGESGSGRYSRTISASAASDAACSSRPALRNASADSSRCLSCRRRMTRSSSSERGLPASISPFLRAALSILNAPTRVLSRSFMAAFTSCCISPVRLTASPVSCPPERAGGGGRPPDRRRHLCDLLQRGDVLLGDDEHVHRRPPPDVLEYQHLVLVVHNLGLDLPTHYLTEYALGLAQQPSTPPYDVLVRLSSSARARATATIPAVSPRSRYGPSRARASPASRASRTSPSLHPPSGPTKRLAGSPATPSRRGSPEALCSRTPPSPTRRTASRKSTGSSTAGTHSLSDWRAAASATRRQRPNFPSRGLTTPRSVRSGTMLVTPTSVAFSTTRSMRPPFGTA